MKEVIGKFATCVAFAISGSFSLTIASSSPVNAEPAGCGSSWSYYALRYVATPISSKQFNVACVEHDKCYDTYRKLKQECDKAFHNRMLGICAKDHNTIFGRPLKARCNKFADIYYSAVLKNGGEAYKKAQDAASKGK